MFNYVAYNRFYKRRFLHLYLIRIKYPLSGFNYHLSGVNVANFNTIHRTVSKQQLF